MTNDTTKFFFNNSTNISFIVRLVIIPQNPTTDQNTTLTHVNLFTRTKTPKPEILLCSSRIY